MEFVPRPEVGMVFRAARLMEGREITIDAVGIGEVTYHVGGDTEYPVTVASWEFMEMVRRMKLEVVHDGGEEA